MEVKLQDINFFDNNKKINIDFKSSSITCIKGENSEKILDLLYGKLSFKEGNILYNEFIYNKNTSKNEIKNIQNKISFLDENYYNKFFNMNVLEDYKYYLKSINMEKLNELLKLFELNQKILYEYFFDLTTSQKTKIAIILCLMSDKELILMNEPTISLDYKSIQSLIKILKKQKQLGKIIIIITNNQDFLLKISDRVITIEPNKVNLFENKYEFFKNKSLLSKLNIIQPYIIEFESYVKEQKNINLGYRDNINDLIKDIYRNAK